MTPSPSVEPESAELTDEQVRWVMGNVARWLDLKRRDSFGEVKTKDV